MGKKFRNQMGFVEEEAPEWLEKAARTNPVVYGYWRIWRRGECTWEEMLVSLTQKLLELNEAHVKHLLALARCENTVYVFPNGEREMRPTPEGELKVKAPAFELLTQGYDPDNLDYPDESEL